jgi:hypothetical protein
MNTFDKIKSFCRLFRIVAGLTLIGVGIYSNLEAITNGELNWSWFYLGLLPLIAGLANFCPLCIISKKCTT